MEKSSSLEKTRVDRIKILLRREDLHQKDLADLLNMEPQNVSRFMKSGKVSEKTCRKIVKLYPEYRIEWLLGYDDVMTHAERADQLQSMKDRIADGIWGMVEKSLNKREKSLRFLHRVGEHPDSTTRLYYDCYYAVVDKDGKELKELTSKEMVQFEQKLQEYCDFITEKYLG